MLFVDDNELGILIDEALGALVEGRGVGGCPPVAQVSVAIELTPMVIESFPPSVP